VFLIEFACQRGLIPENVMVRLEYLFSQGQTRTCQHNAHISQHNGESTGGVNQIRKYGHGHGVVVSLFDLGGPNILILTLHVGELGPLATTLQSEPPGYNLSSRLQLEPPGCHPSLEGAI